MSTPHRNNPYEHGFDSTYRRILTNLTHQELVTVTLELLALLYEVNTELADNPWPVPGCTPVERIVAQRDGARAAAFAKARAHKVTNNKDNSTGITNGKRKSSGASSQGTIKGTGQTGSTGKAKGDVSDSEVR